MWLELKEQIHENHVFRLVEIGLEDKVFSLM